MKSRTRSDRSAIGSRAVAHGDKIVSQAEPVFNAKASYAQNALSQLGISGDRNTKQLMRRGQGSGGQSTTELDPNDPKLWEDMAAGLAKEEADKKAAAEAEQEAQGNARLEKAKLGLAVREGVPGASEKLYGNTDVPYRDPAAEIKKKVEADHVQNFDPDAKKQIAEGVQVARGDIEKRRT